MKNKKLIILIVILIIIIGTIVKLFIDYNNRVDTVINNVFVNGSFHHDEIGDDGYYTLYVEDKYSSQKDLLIQTRDLIYVLRRKWSNNKGVKGVWLLIVEQNGRYLAKRYDALIQQETLFETDLEGIEYSDFADMIRWQ